MSETEPDVLAALIGYVINHGVGISPIMWTSSTERLSDILNYVIRFYDIIIQYTVQRRAQVLNQCYITAHSVRSKRGIDLLKES